MDFSKTYDNPSPEATANIFSRLFYCWLYPIFKYGYRHDLEVKHLYNIAKNDRSDDLASQLERNWENELQRAKIKNNERPKLQRAIIRTFVKQYSLFGIKLFFIWVVLRMIQPLILAELISYFHVSRTKHVSEGYLLATGLIVTALLIIIMGHQTKLGMQRIGMRCRIAVCSLIYRKLLRLNVTALPQTSTGKMINLLSNDVARFDLVFIFFHYLWIVPIQVIVALSIMHKSFGYAAFPGLLLMILQAGPINGYISKALGKIRFKIANRTDHRVQLMNEIVVGMQVIKMYAWEKPFEHLVSLARKLEIDAITTASYFRGLQNVFVSFTQKLTLYVTIMTFVLLENRLSSDKVFSAAQVLYTIEICMMGFFPIATSALAESKTSIKRIEDFLLQVEKTDILSSTVNDEIDRKPSNTVGTVTIQNGTTNWGPNHTVPTLNNINLEIEPGALCVIVGQVGSGKSSLLQLLLRELPLQNGTLNVVGKISCASQEPWLFGSTVRNNILFGMPYIQDKYEKIIKICALERDINLLPHGDHTLVGERGISLSGGQRARINLARAVYRDADIYIFDDPLSAVDTLVGKHLLEECFFKYLGTKTRILVINQLQLLQHADQIVVLNNGEIEKIGTYSDIMKHKLSYLQFCQNTENSIDEALETNENEELLASSNVTTKDSEKKESNETQELIEKGLIPSSLYIRYLRAGANLLVLVISFSMFALGEVVCTGTDVWVMHWTNTEEAKYAKEQQINELLYNNSNNMNNSLLNKITILIGNTTTEIIKLGEHSVTIKPNNLILNALNNITDNTTVVEYATNNTPTNFDFTYLYIYTAFIVVTCSLCFIRSFIFIKICINASTGLHISMFTNVLKAPMRFFNTNPSGRILNRFSKDMGVVDEILPQAFSATILILFLIVGVFGIIFMVTPWMVIPAVILLVYCRNLKNVYLASSQNIKRLEGITRAPVFSHVSASLSGLTTIRTCEAEALLTKEFDNLQNQHTQSWLLYIATTEAFGFYLDFGSVMILTILTFQFLIFDNGTILSGSVGLVLSQTLTLMGMMQFGMKQTAEVANLMTSVERIFQYTRLSTEGSFESISAKKPPRDWPQNGEILFKNLSLRYAPEEEPVLKHLNISIKAGEKVGIVGRTGAGKSSLIAALFRLVPTEGSVIIDKVEIENIGLHDLRKNISTIPQEPILFTASVRHNLDPFGKCDDLTLLKALDNVELKDVILDLDQQVEHGGSNFSTGQRQLVCLARAIISNNKILIIDEGTANVDLQTDALIQRTIRNKFSDCTVLTIAHRLNTVVDSDKILVMDGGEVVEFGHPHELLQNNNGLLSHMLKDAGKNTETEFKNIAEECYHKTSMR